MASYLFWHTFDQFSGIVERLSEWCVPAVSNVFQQVGPSLFPTHSRQGCEGQSHCHYIASFFLPLSSRYDSDVWDRLFSWSNKFSCSLSTSASTFCVNTAKNTLREATPKVHFHRVVHNELCAYRTLTKHFSEVAKFQKKKTILIQFWSFFPQHRFLKIFLVEQTIEDRRTVFFFVDCL